MLEIDRLTIQLPHGMQSRAAAIVRRLARELTQSPQAASGTIERVDAGPVVVHAGVPDEIIARRGAGAVRAAIAAATTRRAAGMGGTASGDVGSAS